MARVRLTCDVWWRCLACQAVIRRKDFVRQDEHHRRCTGVERGEVDFYAYGYVIHVVRLDEPWANKCGWGWLDQHDLDWQEVSPQPGR